jgi:hypothetical protein
MGSTKPRVSWATSVVRANASPLRWSVYGPPIVLKEGEAVTDATGGPPHRLNSPYT